MVYWLLNLGLIVTPFIIAPGPGDIARAPKLAWACSFALVIGLMALRKGKLRPFRNEWALTLAGYALLCYYMSPKGSIKLLGIESGRFWSWEPLYYIMVFLLFTVAVSSIRFLRRKLNLTFKIMSWCGLVMGLLVFIQSLHLDQFFIHLFGTWGFMPGTLGNPTLVGPFLGMVMPIALYRREYVFAGVMAYAIMATRSNVAMVGFVVMVMVYLALKNKWWFISIATLAVVTIPLVIGLYFTNPQFREHCPDNERFLTWSQALHDLTVPVMLKSQKIYAITGRGPGSFKYLFHATHNIHNESKFVYAHNDYVQVAYEMGILGIVLFLGTILCTIRNAITWREIWENRVSGPKRALLAGFACIATCAFGLFVWQVGTHIFYTLVIVGMLHNKSIVGDRNA